MPARVTAGIVHGTVAIADDVHLQVFVDIGVEVPAARGGAAALVRTAQWICNPERRVPGIAVVVAIIAVRASGASASVEPPEVVFAAGHGGKLKPAGRYQSTRRRSSERADAAIAVLVRRRGLIVLRHKRTVVVCGGGGQTCNVGADAT